VLFRSLNELAVAYDYVDVDLLTGDDRTAVMAEIEKWNPSRSFPTLVINQSQCIIGFQPDKIKQAVGK
jgi:glutaredoxin